MENYNRIWIFSSFAWRIIPSSKFCIIIFLLHFFTYPLFGVQKTNLKFINISIEEGFSNNYVKCIIQDSKGYIWFGTDNGLIRYDGIEIITYNHNPFDSMSLSGNMVNVLFEDSKERLWIGTNLGISIYRKDGNYFIQKPLYDIGYIPVNAIFQDKIGDYWFCARGTGVFHYSKELKFIENLRYQPGNSNSINSNFTTGIIEDHDGIIWISSDCGICSYNRNTKKISRFEHNKRLENSLTDSSVLSLFKDSEYNLWICTTNGLNKLPYKSNNFEYFNYQLANLKGTPSSYIYQIAEDKVHGLWIITKEGLCNYDKGGNKLNHIDKSLIQGNFLEKSPYTCIYIDRQNIMWLGSASNGIFYAYSETNSFEYNKNICNALKDIPVRSILKDSKGNIWIGTDGKGLYLFKSFNEGFLHFPALSKSHGQLGGTVILSLFEDKMGDIWLGTYNTGLYKYDRDQKIFNQYLNNPNDPNTLSNNDVRDILEDSNGNILIATNGGGLNIYNKRNNIFNHLKNKRNDFQHSLICDWCTRIYVDSKGDFWIGTYDGLSKFNPNDSSFLNYQHNFHQDYQHNLNKISNNWIYSICEDAKHHIWVGTAEGLNVIIPEKELIYRYFKANGLPDNTIDGIVEDRNGYLWISTNNGISKYDANKDTFKNFDFHYGLQRNEFINGAYYKDINGLIYFGGLSGINIFQPDNIIINNYIPPIAIINIKVNNKLLPISAKGSPLKKQISETSEITLPYNQNTITLEFAALNYIDAKRNHFLIKLEGFDKDWFNIGTQRTYTYTNLNPGNYVFRVKGSNNNDVWNNTGVSLKIIIKPPFWKTIWAYIFYTLIIANTLYFYRVFTIIKISTKKDLLLEHFKREKSEELNQLKIRFFTNISHEFRTPLTLILAPIEKMLKSSHIKKIELISVEKNAKRLLHLVNQLLEFRKIESAKVDLVVQKGDIVEFVKQIAAAFDVISRQKNINYVLSCNEQSIDLWFDHDKMEKILYNLLSNAFKFTLQNGNISILIEKTENEYVQISITDTGIGIAKEKLANIFNIFYQSLDSLGQVGTGIGLAFTKELVALHHGTISVNSELNKGSCFAIMLPLGRIHFTEEQVKHDLNYSFPSGEIQDMISNEFEALNTELAISHEELNDYYTPSANAPLVLIVEDNKELRTFICNNLLSRFRVIEASDGLEAIDLALHESPDLIISDIMMPKMDGIEFCRRIKENIQTNHIPLILLTAIHSDESILEGTKAGADDYVTKPFGIKELVLKINNIINTRKNLQEKYNREIILTPKDITATSADEKFMITIMGLIEDNIKDPDFDFMVAASKIGISRSVLYRKMQKLMGKSPNEFVNTIRLKKAAQLLKQKKFKVSDVAYEVGFKDPLYFSKCFKKLFDLTPSDYAKIGL